MNTHVLFAVFRRNFVSYFASPTGYVFICLFVLLGAIAAFWVPDFFGNNLANLDQLSFWFPFIMLIYIPTITMGIWADERKQGTDELLLTIPAADFDIVLGQVPGRAGHLHRLAAVLVGLQLPRAEQSGQHAAACSTFSPRLDFGLFLGTYAGYWLVGLAMLGIGLVASFLTGNITIGFVLGVLFNMPLVFLVRADALFGSFGREARAGHHPLEHRRTDARLQPRHVEPAGHGLFPRDPRGHALREHGADRPAALVQRPAAMVAGRPFPRPRPGPGRHRRWAWSSCLRTTTCAAT